jgi:hypothetical protein
MKRAYDSEDNWVPIDLGNALYVVNIKAERWGINEKENLQGGLL